MRKKIITTLKEVKEEENAKIEVLKPSEAGGEKVKTPLKLLNLNPSGGMQVKIPLKLLNLNPSGGMQPRVEKRGRKRKRNEIFARFINRVLKKLLPGFRISSKSMSIMNSFMTDIFERIGAEAGLLCQRNKQSTTVLARDIQAAVILVLSGQLCKCAVSEGIKACVRYRQSFDSEKA